MRKLYLVWDNKAEAPAGAMASLHVNDNVAVREFSDVLNMEGSRVGQHAEDYDLVCLGELGSENGTPTTTGEVRFVLNGKVLMDAQKEAANG